MPRTASSSSTAANGPLAVRCSTMACAVAGPMPGSASSSSTVARLRSIGPAGAVDPAAAARPAGPPRRPPARRSAPRRRARRPGSVRPAPRRRARRRRRRRPGGPGRRRQLVDARAAAPRRRRGRRRWRAPSGGEDGDRGRGRRRGRAARGRPASVGGAGDRSSHHPASTTATTVTAADDQPAGAEPLDPRSQPADRRMWPSGGSGLGPGFVLERHRPPARRDGAHGSGGRRCNGTLPTAPPTSVLSFGTGPIGPLPNDRTGTSAGRRTEPRPQNSWAVRRRR